MPALKQSIQSTMEEPESDGKEFNSEEKLYSPNYISVPLVAVPEKIVFCIDITEDASCKPYSSKNSNGNPFFQLKKCLSCFIHNKNSFNNEHEFAVLSFEPGGVKWIQEFSNDPKVVVQSIDKIQIICQSEPIDFDLMPVFKEVKEHIGILPDITLNSVQLPNYVVRVILLYNSSFNIPKIDTSDEKFTYLMKSDYFKLDILYLHDAPSEENNCQEIFDTLLNLASSRSYVFESSRKIVKLYNNMAKLLAHPFQRFEQPSVTDS